MNVPEKGVTFNLSFAYNINLSLPAIKYFPVFTLVLYDVLDTVKAALDDCVIRTGQP